MAIILGIETSCDETAASVVVAGCEVRSNVVASQADRHSPYGGVVPELAAREHLIAIEPVVSEALKNAGCKVRDIDAVAVTNGPGLLPALLIGVNFAKGLAVSNNIPLIGINHFIAHVYGAFLDESVEALQRSETYPLLALVVSGGHTALMLTDRDGNAQVVGSTLDDAAGEAFDKAAKLLGLGYPGGPVIERIAKKGNPAKFAFPRSLTGTTGRPLDKKNRFNFSFSGVKTALLYHCKELGEDSHIQGKLLYDTVASYQEAIVDVLCRKTIDASESFEASSIVLCGGVACNNSLRERFQASASKNLNLYIAKPKYCTDNAAMIAGLAWHYYRNGYKDDLDLDAFSRLSDFKKVPFIK